MPETTRDEIARLQEEYDKNPEGRLFVHLAEAHRRNGDLEEARSILYQGLERHSDYLSARIVLAQVETELGNGAGALDVWREVVQLDPDNELALWALAELEYNEGNPTQSLGFYRRLAELGVDDGELDEMIALLEATVADGGEAPPQAAVPPTDEDESPRAAAPPPAFEVGGPALGSRAPHGASGGESTPSRGGSQEQLRRRNQNGSNALAHTDAIGLSDLLVRLLEYRDATFHAGSSLTRLLAVSIGHELELERIHVEALALAALLSDLGGLGVAAGEGQPISKLAEGDERRQAEQREVAISLQLLQGITLPAGVHEAVRHQHERWDGKGYPDGLREEEIPYAARVIAVARACADALTTVNGGGGVTAALDGLQRNAGSRYDPVVVSVLRRVFQRRSDHGIGFGLGGRVVVVTAEELRGLGIATQLHSEGYVAEVAADTGRARESVRRAGPKAVVLGAGLAGDDLSRFIRELRGSADLSATPLIVLDVNDMDHRVELLTAGADVCFASEVSFREFKATLDALLRRREEVDRPRERSERIDTRF